VIQFSDRNNPLTTICKEISINSKKTFQL